jgi:O-antigen ligase
MKNLQLGLNLEFLKTYSLEIGVFLCFVLPPVGILWLLCIGWYQLNKTIDLKVPIYLNTTIFFYVCLAIAAFGSSFSQKNEQHMLIFAMVLGYLGLYLYMREHASLTLIYRFKRIMIIGGIYLIALGNLLREITVSNPILGFLTGTEYIGPSEESGGRLFGSAYNPNFTSFLLLVILAFLLADLLKKKYENSNTLTKWDFFLPLFIVMGIFQTGSRSGIGVMFIVLVLFLLKLAPKIGITVIILILFANNQILELIPRFNILNEAFLERKVIWENSIRIWKEHPFFGTTPLGFYDAYLHVGKSVIHEPIYHAHNIFLATFSEYGTIGGLAFLLLLMTITLKLCCLVFLNAKKKELLNFFLLSLPVILLTGIFDHPLVSPQTALLTTILIGCWDRYTESIPFVEKSIFTMKRAFAKVIYVDKKPLPHHLTETEKK